MDLDVQAFAYGYASAIISGLLALGIGWALSLLRKI